MTITASKPAGQAPSAATATDPLQGLSTDNPTVEIPTESWDAIASLLEDVAYLAKSENYDAGEKVLPYQHQHLASLSGEARALLARLVAGY